MPTLPSPPSLSIPLYRFYAFLNAGGKRRCESRERELDVVVVIMAIIEELDRGRKDVRSVAIPGGRVHRLLGGVAFVVGRVEGILLVLGLGLVGEDVTPC